MAFTHVVNLRLTISGAKIENSNTYSATERVSLEDVAPDSDTTQMDVSIEVGQIQSFFLVSDRAVTVYTNSPEPTVADDSIALVAGVPYFWNTDSYDELRFGTSITAIYVENSSGEEATVQLEALVDPTP